LAILEPVEASTLQVFVALTGAAGAAAEGACGTDGLGWAPVAQTIAVAARMPNMIADPY
jgi:hypothetical protein